MSRNIFRLVLAALTAASLVAGCSGSDDEAGGNFSTKPQPSTGHTRTVPTTSPTPSKSGVGPTSTSRTGMSLSGSSSDPSGSTTGGSAGPAGLTTPAAKKAEKFVRDYLAAYNKATQNPKNIADLKARASSSCGSCEKLSKSIVELDRKSRRQTGPEVSVAKILVRPGDDGTENRLYVNVRIQQHPVPGVDSKGRVVDRVEEIAGFDRAFDVGGVHGSPEILRILVLKRAVWQ